jgi:hypothetical protein
MSQTKAHFPLSHASGERGENSDRKCRDRFQTCL